MPPITSVNQLMEMLDPTFTWSLGVDRAFATMSFVARNDMDGACDGTKLETGYAQTDNKITLDNLNEALQLILPVVGVDKSLTEGNSYRLRRNVPIIFPYRGQVYSADNQAADNYRYYAQSCNVKPSGSGERKRSPDNTTYLEKLQTQPYNAQYRGGSPNSLRHPYYECAVDFEPVDFEYLADSDLAKTQIQVPNPTFGYNPPANLPKFSGGLNAAGAMVDTWDEYYRNVRVQFNPFLDVLTLEGGQLYFAENPNPNPDNVTYYGTPFPAPWSRNERKGVLHVEWFNVPADFVLDDDGLPRMFLRALGSVNSFRFLGAYEGTLLLREPPEFKRKPYGAKFGAYQWNGNAAGYQYPWLYDIQMKFIYFDPVPGNSNQTIRGHNLFPAKRQMYDLLAVRPPDNLAINPNTPNLANYPKAFPEFDFRWLFQYAGAW